MKFFLIFLSLLSFAALPSIGQENESPVTVTIPRPPRLGHWIIDYSYDAGKPQGTVAPTVPIGPKRSEYTVTGKTASEQQTLQDGSTLQTYQLDRYLLTELPKTHQIQISNLDTLLDSTQEYRKFYPGFAGMDPSSYTGVVKAFGEKCLHFKTSVGEAWVSLTTQLPVAYKMYGRTGHYTFLEPPTSPLQLPERFQASMKAHFNNNTAPAQASSLAQ